MIINGKGAYDIRMATASDREYILKSWMLAYEQAPEMRMPGLIRDDYFAYTHRLLDELISRSSEKGSMYVCHQPNASYMIRGFLCAEAYTDFPVVHWVHTRKSEKKKGVASALIEQFYKDFEIQPGNLIYTFSSRDLMGKYMDGKYNDEFPKRMTKRYNLCYLPWWKFTTATPGWEA